MADIQMPTFTPEVFFTEDTVLFAEQPAATHGVSGEAGDPLPVHAYSDNVLTALLLCFFIFAVIAFSSAREFLMRQAKNFFYPQHEGTTEFAETAGEVRFQVFLMLLTSLLIALMFYFYTLQIFGNTFVLDSQYLLIAVFLAVVMGYFLLRSILYIVVNNVFFDSKKNKQWMKAFLFIVTVEGALFFPAVLLYGYLELSVENVVVYVAIVLIFVKLLTIYKCYIIFFRRNVVSLQIILYFCALELIPLLVLIGTLGITASSLKINF